MNILIIFLFFSFFHSYADKLSNEIYWYSLNKPHSFTWVGGPSSHNAISFENVYAPPWPASRSSAVSWQTDDKYYIFGGRMSESTKQYRYDFWEMDKNINWRYLGTSNYTVRGNDDISYGMIWPSSRRMTAAWVYNNHLYLFGGYGNFDIRCSQSETTRSYTNDLWRYSIGNEQWEVLRSFNCSLFTYGSYGAYYEENSSNWPLAREGPSTWMFPSNLFMFGGKNGTHKNDFWIYNHNSDMWIWVGGSDHGNIKGTCYGHDIIPGARYGATHATIGKYGYIFGGYGYNCVPLSNAGYLNDLFRFDSTTYKWEYLGGATSDKDEFGAYIGNMGTKGLASKDYLPHGRYNSMMWSIDEDIYVFGGWGSSDKKNPYWNDEAYGMLNDLWKYDSSGEWTWIGGDKIEDALGTFGNLGVENWRRNWPGGKDRSVVWYDNTDILVYSGLSYDCCYQDDYTESTEVWKYHPGGKPNYILAIFYIFPALACLTIFIAILNLCYRIVYKDSNNISYHVRPFSLSYFFMGPSSFFGSLFFILSAKNEIDLIYFYISLIFFIVFLFVNMILVISLLTEVFQKSPQTSIYVRLFYLIILLFHPCSLHAMSCKAFNARIFSFITDEKQRMSKNKALLWAFVIHDLFFIVLGTTFVLIVGWNSASIYLFPSVGLLCLSPLFYSITGVIIGGGSSLAVAPTLKYGVQRTALNRQKSEKKSLKMLHSIYGVESAIELSNSVIECKHPNSSTISSNTKSSKDDRSETSSDIADSSLITTKNDSYDDFSTKNDSMYDDF